MIRTLTKFLVPGLAALTLAPAVFADGRTPGSVLVYPIHRSSFGPIGTPGAAVPHFTIISVTNTDLLPMTPNNGLGGSTNIHWEYVNVTPGSTHTTNSCQVVDTVEFLTPADTRSVLTNCHNATSGQEGYLVISAQDPNAFSTAWSHNYLIGSELVLGGTGGMYSLNAIPFDAIAGEGAATDSDMDGQLDFDNVEYEPIADNLYLDVFYAVSGSSITLINMTGGFNHTANVNFDVWNDNEQALSATLAFNCWIEEPLDQISVVFNGAFLATNTLHDATELDVFGCDMVGDVETGWARVRGANASSSVESIPNPALLGAITAGPAGPNIDGGHLLWESKTTQTNGDFFKTGTDDPEN
jgi:hypothetical protein